MHVSVGRATKILISSFIMLSELQKIICPFPFFRLSKLLGSKSLHVFVLDLNQLSSRVLLIKTIP